MYADVYTSSSFWTDIMETFSTTSHFTSAVIEYVWKFREIKHRKTAVNRKSVVFLLIQRRWYSLRLYSVGTQVKLHYVTINISSWARYRVCLFYPGSINLVFMVCNAVYGRIDKIVMKRVLLLWHCCYVINSRKLSHNMRNCWLRFILRLRGRGGTAPHILDFAARWSWMVELCVSAGLPFPLHWCLGVHSAHSGCDSKQKNPCSVNVNSLIQPGFSYFLSLRLLTACNMYCVRGKNGISQAQFGSFLVSTSDIILLRKQKLVMQASEIALHSTELFS